MAKIYHIHQQESQLEVQPDLTPQKRKKLQLFEEMLVDLGNRLRSRRCQDGKVNKAKSSVMEFQTHSKKLPWEWSREDFESHCTYLFKDKGNSVSTQRGKQKDIKEFTEFLINSKYFNIVQNEYNVILKPICFPDNMIVHKVESDNKTKRRSFTAFELEKFFSKMDDCIFTCWETRSKTYKVAMRDKALFGIMSFFGLRDFEISMLDIDDLYANPDFPEFGKYGLIHVRFGKGSAGTHYKERRVYTMDVQAKDLLEWYVKEIRPLFIGRATKDIKALFFNERGGRVSTRTMQINFKKYLHEFDMYKEGLTPHSMRHSYSTINQEDGNVSSHLMQKQLGHALLSTTQGYTNIGDPFVRKHLKNVVEKNIKQRLERMKDDSEER